MRNRDGTISAQQAMLRLAERDYGLTVKRLNLETGIPVPTIQSWRRDLAPALMSLADFVAICRVVPDELTSLCMEASGKHIGTDESGGDDTLEALTVEASGTVHEIAKARLDGKLTPQERARIGECARRLTATARKIAA